MNGKPKIDNDDDLLDIKSEQEIEARNEREKHLDQMHEKQIKRIESGDFRP
jgi:hypothetical protein